MFGAKWLLFCIFDFRPPSKPNFGDEFRKPIWFDDCETDDELFDNNAVFGFQIFTNPLEMQKHFEQQMQEMLKTLDQFEGKISIRSYVTLSYLSI